MQEICGKLQSLNTKCDQINSQYSQASTIVIQNSMPRASNSSIREKKKKEKSFS